VSHIIKTFLWTFKVSFKAFLSNQESQTIVSLFSKKSGRVIFVKIPAGYFFVNALIPVNSENFSTTLHPACLLHTTIISFGSKL